MNSYFPLFIDVSQFRTVFVGGGRIAERRVQTLQQYGAHIIVIAPEITEGLKQLVKTNQILWENRGYREEDLSDPTI